MGTILWIRSGRTKKRMTLASRTSPLGRDVRDDDGSVEICIYRGVEETQWIFEDKLGGSTVCDERFDSDQLALDAALRAIEEENIRSFYVESRAHRDV